MNFSFSGTFFYLKRWVWMHIEVPFLIMCGWRNAALDKPIPYEDKYYRVRRIGKEWNGKYISPPDGVQSASGNSLETGSFEDEITKTSFIVGRDTYYKKTWEIKKFEKDLRKKQQSYEPIK